ncbi:CLUMA_CG011272, isoform A [Clunio marinus]|uniref:CLUMA_CG011272, isoform A n=1 Tax=Clunio marinus TaxID=568069 RepID=A0A1J1IHH4_9DIPT|nr:CLUMA_CG011272, isoform A [Clunio marinus]
MDFMQKYFFTSLCKERVLKRRVGCSDKKRSYEIAAKLNVEVNRLFDVCIKEVFYTKKVVNRTEKNETKKPEKISWKCKQATFISLRQRHHEMMLQRR